MSVFVVVSRFVIIIDMKNSIFYCTLRGWIKGTACSHIVQRASNIELFYIRFNIGNATIIVAVCMRFKPAKTSFYIVNYVRTNAGCYTRATITWRRLKIL